MVRPRIGGIAALVAGLLAMLPSGAFAQGSGVHVDPGSPAGKEYAIPVDRARRDAGVDPAPAATTTPSTSGQAPAGDDDSLFGAGIKPRGGGSGGSGGKSRGKTQADADGGTVAVPDAAEPAPGAPAQVNTTSSSGSPVPWLLGGAALVLVLGAGLGLAMRRSPRLSPDT